MNTTDPTPTASGVERLDDRPLREDLDRFRLEAVIARQDAAGELVRELQAAAWVDFGDVSAAVARPDGDAIPSLGELEALFVGPDAGLLRIGEPLLADLLREGVEGQTVLKRGIAFLKHKEFASAAEWWSLNRAGLDPAASKLHLLLLIMEALTHHWSGDTERADQVRDKVHAHPLFHRPRVSETRPAHG